MSARAREQPKVEAWGRCSLSPLQLGVNLGYSGRGRLPGPPGAGTMEMTSVRPAGSPRLLSSCADACATPAPPSRAARRLLGRAWPSPAAAATAASLPGAHAPHHGHRRWLPRPLALAAALTLALILFAAGWGVQPAADGSQSSSLVPAWFKPLITGGWRGSYAGSGETSSFVRDESDFGSGNGVTCAQVG